MVQYEEMMPVPSSYGTRESSPSVSESSEMTPSEAESSTPSVSEGSNAAGLESSVPASHDSGVELMYEGPHRSPVVVAGSPSDGEYPYPPSLQWQAAVMWRALCGVGG